MNRSMEKITEAPSPARTNRSMEKLSAGPSLARADKEAFIRTLQRVVTEAASLGDCFDGTRRVLEATVEMELERLASSDFLHELEEAEQNIWRSIEARAKELQSSEMKVGVVKSHLDGTLRDLEARKEELRGVDELLALRRTELVVKNKELDSVSQELLTKEAELKAVRDAVLDCTQSVDLKTKELDQILAKIEESRWVREEIDVRSKSPKSKELRIQLQPCHHLTVNQNERPPQERGFPHCANSVNPGEKTKTKLLKIVPSVGSTFPTDTCQNSLDIADDTSNEVSRFFAEMRACELDPAEVVLNLTEGSYQHQSIWDAEDIYFLDQVRELSPAISREVMGRAFELAIKWKIKLEDKLESKCSALGFFHFLAAYKLMHLFSTSQIRLLAEACSLTKSHPELCLALGLTAEKDAEKLKRGAAGTHFVYSRRGIKRPRSFPVAVPHQAGSGQPDRGIEQPRSTSGKACKQLCQESRT